MEFFTLVVALHQGDCNISIHEMLPCCLLPKKITGIRTETDARLEVRFQLLINIFLIGMHYKDSGDAALELGQKKVSHNLLEQP